MNIEEKLLIAKNVFPNSKITKELSPFLDYAAYVQKGNLIEMFDPERDDADAFKVLRALWKKGLSAEFDNSHIFIDGEKIKTFSIPIIDGNLNEAICRAYLNTIGEEG